MMVNGDDVLLIVNKNCVLMTANGDDALLIITIIGI
jgi:hypothetical protein